MKKIKLLKTSVISNREVRPGSEVFQLRIVADHPDIKIGQFYKLIPQSASQTPKPFAVVSHDAQSITFLIKVVGPNTKIFSSLKKGDSIRTFGPCGSPFTFDKIGKKTMLVCGGVGTSALIPVALRFKEIGTETQVFLGTKEKKQIVFRGLFKKSGFRVCHSCEDGSTEKTFVTELLEEALTVDNGQSTVIACGPKAMLKKVAELCRAHGNLCFVYLEEMMACGVGDCKGCAIPLLDKNVKLVCKDGPVFNASEINWEELVPPKITIIPSKRKSKNPFETTFRTDNGLFRLEYPTLTCSGCSDLGAILDGPLETDYIGAYVLKGLTLEEIFGNRGPRLCETPSGMLNSIGLQNIGLKKFLDLAPLLKKLGKPVIPNIAGKSVEEFVRLAVALEAAGFEIIELNISCPNDKRHNKFFALHPDLTYELVSEVRKAAPGITIITKLSPRAQYIAEIAGAAVKGGSQILSVGNTYPGMAIDPWTLRPKLGGNTGGLSGPAIHPINLLKVNEVYRAGLGVPIIGEGGIRDAYGAMGFFLAGASAIACGTAAFTNPEIFKEICEGLKLSMDYHKVNNIGDFVGKVALY